MATAAFNWYDFFTLANELAARSEEYCHRTAVSRTYYYVYHLARQRILDNQFIIFPGGDSHKQVWEKFDSSPDFECKKLYQLAQKLKDKRQRADYDNNFPRVADELPAVLDMAKKFADGLSRLDHRLPTNSGVRAR